MTLNGCGLPASPFAESRMTLFRRTAPWRIVSMPSWTRTDWLASELCRSIKMVTSERRSRVRQQALG
jgi:hypothetical protein